MPEIHKHTISQVRNAAASMEPSLLPLLARGQSEFLARVAVYETQLRALPRRVRRALQRQWRLPLAGIALMLALGQPLAQAATIPVSAGCTLIDAITAANTDTATEGCPAGSGADTIILPAGSTQTLTEVNNRTYGPTGLPVISTAITIAGQESTIVRDGEAPEFRILAVGSTGDLTLQETTVSGGASPTLIADGNVTSYNGGGVANYGGTLTMMNSSISGNSSPATFIYDDVNGYFNVGGGGGGVANFGAFTMTNSAISGNSTGSLFSQGGDGGGVANFGTFTMTNSTISGNNTDRSFGNGGGVANFGTFTMTHSTISGNDICYGSGGGGVFNEGTITITHSTISGNTHNSEGAASGGGVFNEGTITITHSIISGNFAHNDGGSYGGGIRNGGSLTIINSTISGNEAFDGLGFSRGGGVANGGSLTILNSTIEGNYSERDGGGIRNGGSLTITNSTISGNTSSLGSGSGVHNGGSLTITNSTITGNDARYSYAIGGVVNVGTLMLVRTLVTGNTALSGALEVSNSGTVTADNSNLFGMDGNAGVEGFTPGPTDIVPPAGVQLSDILNPTLTNNGGLTQTHALVPGSPAIDAGGPVCTDAEGNPLLTDQRGEPRLVDGDGDGQAACDIGAFEVQGEQDQGEVIDFEDIPAGTVVTEVFSNSGFGPIKVRGKLDDSCAYSAAVVFDSSCTDGVCSGDDQDLGAPNETFGGPGQGEGGEVGSRWANDEPLGNLLIVHERCAELSEGMVQNPDDTEGASTITLKFPQPVRVLSYTIIDSEPNERDKVKLVGKQGEQLATLEGPTTGNNGKAVVQTTSDGTGISGVIRMVFKRRGSRGIDNIVFVPEARHEQKQAKGGQSEN